jgi:hypothetical protein
MGRSLNGSRIAAQLAAKASRLTDRVEELRFAICAREQVTDPTAGSAHRHGGGYLHDCLTRQPPGPTLKRGAKRP